MSDSAPNLELKISFPKSDQDHRLQLVDINGSVFALLHSPLQSNGPIELDCMDWSLILLAPIKSKEKVFIRAINVVCLNTIESEESSISVSAENRLVSQGALFKAGEEVACTGVVGEHQLDDEGGLLLNYATAYGKMIANARKEERESIREAQQGFLRSLCSLSGQIEKREIDIYRVLQLWDIAPC